MSELINCKTCGGKVSTAASMCPHCGEPNFKPASYLAKERQLQQQEEARRRQIALADMDRRLGYNLEVYAEGEYPDDWYTHIRIKGTRVRGYYERLNYDSEKRLYGSGPVHVRLLPGNYKAEYVELSVYSHGFNEIITTGELLITETSRRITLRFE